MKPTPIRIRTGVSRWGDGWNVIVEVNGKKSVYDPTYATEAECQEAADRASDVLRERFGLPRRPSRPFARGGVVPRTARVLLGPGDFPLIEVER